MKSSSFRASAVIAILVAGFLAAPRAQQPPQQPSQQQTAEPQQGGRGRGQAPPAGAPSTPVKPLVPLAASTLVKNPQPYYGENVTVTAAVEQTLSKTSFSVDQDKTRSTGQEVLVVAPTMHDPVDPNTYVTVIGELMPFD